MVVDQRRYLSFHDVDFKALSPSTFLDTLLGLNALRHLYLYSIRNQTFAQINDRLLLALAKSGLRDLSHSGDVNTDHVTGNLSGRGIIKFLTFDDAPRSLTVNHPRLSPSFLSELIEVSAGGSDMLAVDALPVRSGYLKEYRSPHVDIRTVLHRISGTE